MHLSQFITSYHICDIAVICLADMIWYDLICCDICDMICVIRNRGEFVIWSKSAWYFMIWHVAFFAPYHVRPFVILYHKVGHITEFVISGLWYDFVIRVWYVVSDMLWYDVIWCDMMWYGFMIYQSSYVMIRLWYYVIWCDTDLWYAKVHMSWYVMISHDIGWYDVISCDIMTWYSPAPQHTHLKHVWYKMILLWYVCDTHRDTLLSPPA